MKEPASETGMLSDQTIFQAGPCCARPVRDGKDAGGCQQAEDYHRCERHQGLCISIVVWTFPYGCRDKTHRCQAQDGKLNGGPFGQVRLVECNSNQPANSNGSCEQRTTNSIGFDFSNKGESDGKRCLLYTSPSPRDQRGSRMPSSA